MQCILMTPLARPAPHRSLHHGWSGDASFGLKDDFRFPRSPGGGEFDRALTSLWPEISMARDTLSPTRRSPSLRFVPPASELAELRNPTMRADGLRGTRDNPIFHRKLVCILSRPFYFPFIGPRSFCEPFSQVNHNEFTCYSLSFTGAQSDYAIHTVCIVQKHYRRAS